MSFNYVTLSFVYCAAQAVAITLSLFRLAVRLKIQRFWWEDLWAALASVFAIAFTVVLLLFFETYPYKTMLIACTYMFTSIVWSARMSILYSIIRTISPSSILRRVSRGFVALFLLFWATLVVLKTWRCAYNTQTMSGRPVCFVPNFILIIEVITDCIADTALVVLPLKLLWRVKLPRRQRRMILFIFSSSSILSIISLVHAITQVTNVPVAQEILVDIESITSIIVCNLLVVITYAYRVLSSSPDGELPSDLESSSDDDFTTPLPRSLTTVDLDTPNPTDGVISLFRRTLSSLARYGA